MKEWKGLIAGLLLGVCATLAIGAATTTDSNGRYQLKVIVTRDRQGTNPHVDKYMLDTRTGDFFYLSDRKWWRSGSLPEAAKPGTDPSE